MPKITPFLWFDDQAEEAMNFYLSIFKDSKVLNISRYGDAGPGPKGGVMTASFELNGQVLAGYFICRTLRNPSGTGPLLGKTIRRRQGKSMCLAGR